MGIWTLILQIMKISMLHGGQPKIGFLQLGMTWSNELATIMGMIHVP
jgi:hypothetical protein